jgi:putative oxidoreductase
MKTIVLTGRILYSLIFITSGFGHFSQHTVIHAQQHGVPMAGLLVPFSGFLALLGGLSVAIGWKAKWGAVLLLLFLIPVTVMMHNFWTVDDPQMRQVQQAMFLKNISMTGAALLIFYHGAGPLSLDNRAKKSED